MGPTSFNVGDLEEAAADTLAMAALQWGRRLSTSETGRQRPNDVSKRMASMGPTSFNVGDAEALAYGRAVDAASMGPTSFNVGDRL